MSVRVHRLLVTYPDGSHDEHGVPVPGWEPANGWVPDGPSDDLRYIEEGPRPFQWPRRHLYLSKDGAVARANLLRSFGATVEVQSSKPVEWDGDR
jgi:hypothetical protein